MLSSIVVVSHFGSGIVFLAKASSSIDREFSHIIAFDFRAESLCIGRGIKLQIKSYVLSLFNDLLHLLMKFSAVWSIRVVKTITLYLAFLSPMTNESFKRNCGIVDLC